MKYWYKTTKDKKGNDVKYRCWRESFKDEDTDNMIYITRHRPILVNGEKTMWFGRK